jgi:hypothetical protein
MLFASGNGQPALAEKPVARPEFAIQPGQFCIVLSVLGAEVRGTFVEEREWWLVVREAKGRERIHVRKDLI